MKLTAKDTKGIDDTFTGYFTRVGRTHETLPLYM